MGSTRPTILIADDHLVVAEGLSVSLRVHYTVVGLVTTLDTLLDAIRNVRPEVVILDLVFGSESSLPSLIEAVLDQTIRTRFVVLTGHDSPALARAAFEAGASAFLLKGASTHELRMAIDAALEGRRYFAEERSRAPRGAVDSPYGPKLHVAGIGLRVRQVQVLNFLLDGLTRQEMADRLGLSLKGVDHHIQAASTAVGTTSLRLLSLWAAEHVAALRAAGIEVARREAPETE